MRPTTAYVIILWLIVVLQAIGLFGCASVPVTVPVQGNGHCHPSHDLPKHKTLKPVPEKDVGIDDFWALLAGERKDHARDARDYNSLHDQCVDPTW